MKHVLSVLIALCVTFSLFAEGKCMAADYGGYRPHYQGYGVNTPGGRGGKILKVTNLNDSGPGSLREALEAEGPRIVIFETSGTIALQSQIQITHPYLTVAGQTAPSPGINIRNQAIHISAHDIVIQHIRMRYGDTNPQPYEGTVFQVKAGGDNVVFDHVSVAWSTYLGFGANDITGACNVPKDIAVLDSIVSYGLVKGGAGFWGLGALMGLIGSYPETHHYTYARNLFVHNAYRCPWISAGRFQVVNNVIYGSGPWEGWEYTQFWPNQIGNSDTYNREPKGGVEAVIVNNRMIPSTGTGSGDTAGSLPTSKALSFNVHPDNVDFQSCKVWLAGNRGPGITNNGTTLQDQKNGIYWMTDAGSQDFSRDPRLWYSAVPSWHASQNFRTIPTDEADDYLLANAGARPLDRDVVDKKAVAHTKAGLVHDLPHMGTRVKSQDDMGGYPVLVVHTRKLQIPENPHDVAPGQKFRTNIEMWLEKYARELEPAL